MSNENAALNAPIQKTEQDAPRFASGHTPGPWKPRGTDVYGAGCLIARVPTMATTPGSTRALDQAIIDTRLIAAAPDLIDALHVARRVLVVACGTEAPYIREALKILDAAVAKAEG